MSPATTKVAECPQLPLRWLNVPSYPEVAEYHSVNSHTVIIHEDTIYNTMYHPTSRCSDQAFNMMIGGHSINAHTVLYASYPKVAECLQLPWGSWMSQCKCTHCNLCRLPWGIIPTVIQHLIWCWMSQCKCTHCKLCRLPWGIIPTAIQHLTWCWMSQCKSTHCKAMPATMR
jgi:hypothetical protein